MVQNERERVTVKNWSEKSCKYTKQQQQQEEGKNHNIYFIILMWSTHPHTHTHCIDFFKSRFNIQKLFESKPKMISFIKSSRKEFFYIPLLVYNNPFT